MPEGEKRDCQHKRANHQHGTVNAYVNDKCKCVDCRRAIAERMAARRRTEYLSTITPHLEPAAVSLARIDALRLAGWTLPYLARRLGYSHTRSLSHLYERESIRTTTARKIRTLHAELINTPPPKGAHGEAKRAATFARKRLNLPDPPPPEKQPRRTNDELVEDFLFIVGNGIGTRDPSKIGWTLDTRRAAAPRLGISVDALDRALYRAA